MAEVIEKRRVVGVVEGNVRPVPIIMNIRILQLQLHFGPIYRYKLF